MKIALISGASSGMGRELAIQIAYRFPSIEEIWINARREECLRSLEREFPGRIRVFPGDLLDPETIPKLTKALIKAQATVCILGNAAGFGKLGRAGEISPADLQAMITLNCTALTQLTEAVLPFMKKKSRIIHFASAAAFLPQPGFAVYAATKSYVLSYSLALRRELADRGIAVTAVCPGPVDTEFFSIAEEHAPAPAYKRFFMTKTERVVSKALFDAFSSPSGKAVSVPGAAMKAVRIFTKLLPWELCLHFYD